MSEQHDAQHGLTVTFGASSAAVPSRPRVLFAIGGLGTGGSERQLVELACRTHRRAIDASVVTFQDAASAAHTERLRAAGIEHHSIPRPPGNRLLRAMGLAPQVASLVRSIDPDVIYAWLEETTLYLAPIARLQRVPLLVARRNVCGSRSERYLMGRAAIRAAERSAALVTVNSPAAAAEARRRGIRPNRIRCVRNGHDLVEALPMPDDPMVRLGCVAQFRPEKGHRRLLEALSRISTPVPWHVDLAGRGPLMSELKRETAARGLADRVRFLGELDDVRSFWATQHVALLLSDSEGSPNALIEAALAGRPIVATSTGGTPDVVAPEGGVLVAPDDHSAAASAITRLINDAELRHRLGDMSHRQATERFAMEAFIEGHLSAVREVLASGR